MILLQHTTLKVCYLEVDRDYMARSPCNNKPVAPFLFGCGGNMYDKSLTNIPVLTNVTRMLSGSVWIPPFPVINVIGAPQCSDYFGAVCGVDGVICSSSIQGALGPNTQSYTIGVSTNNFISSSTTMSLAACDFYGFKSLFGYKSWLGRKGFTSGDWGATDVSTIDWCGVGGTAPCGNQGWQPAQSVDTMKYLQITGQSNVVSTVSKYSSSVSFEGVVTCPFPTYGDYCTSLTLSSTQTTSSTATITSTADRYSGNLIQSCVSSSTPNTPVSAAYALSLIQGFDTTNNTLLMDQYCQQLTDIQFAMSAGPDTMTQGAGSLTVQWHTPISCSTAGCPVGPSPILIWEIIITNTTLDVYKYGTNGDGPSDPTIPKCFSTDPCTEYVQVQHIHYAFTATDFYYGLDTLSFQTYSYTEYHEDVTASLSIPNPESGVNDDIVALIIGSGWDLSDDNMYPYRLDSRPTAGPLICYDEAGGVPTLVLCYSVTGSTGKILGGPAPSGVTQWYDDTHNCYQVCSYVDSFSDTCYEFFINTYGAWSTDPIYGAFCPRATKFMDCYQSSNIPQSNFCNNGQFFDFPGSCNSIGPKQQINDTKWFGIYIPVYIRRQSYDYTNRPCGADAFQISQSSAICVASASGLILSLTGSTPTIITTGQRVIVEGVSGSVNGMWIAGAVSPYQVTLGQSLATGSAVPYYPYNTGTTSGYVGKARFQGAPLICSGSDNGYYGDATINTWISNYRDIGEAIRINEVSTSMAQQLNCEGVQCSGPASVTIPRIQQAICGLSQDVSNNPICQQTCISLNLCAPMIIYTSPVTWSFKGSPVYYPWTWNVIDSIYGSSVQSLPKQSMNSPFAQVPPRPCDYPIGQWLEDNGSCENDNPGGTPPVEYYPMYDHYESRCSVPSGSNALPAGCYVGCLSPNNFTGSSICPAGIICDKPSAPNTYPLMDTDDPYLVNLTDTPWLDQLNRESCVCSDGRFAYTYWLNGIKCPSTPRYIPPIP